jgi:hypothetical protein
MDNNTLDSLYLAVKAVLEQYIEAGIPASSVLLFLNASASNLDIFITKTIEVLKKVGLEDGYVEDDVRKVILDVVQDSVALLKDINEL